MEGAPNATVLSIIKNSIAQFVGSKQNKNIS